MSLKDGLLGKVPQYKNYGGPGHGGDYIEIGRAHV